MYLRDKLRALRGQRTTDLAERFARLEAHLSKIGSQVELLQEGLGRIENRQLAGTSATNLAKREYRVFSQWGEDGIIQFLLEHISIDKTTFIEFGVTNYQEANTRFLLVNNNWSGLVLDSSREFIDNLRAESISWRYCLTAIQAFITRENINQLISANGMSGEIGLLSIDIDGNDYWVWQAADVVNPAIVVIEYNHRFGGELAVTIPYDADFRRGETYPQIYFGASLAALCQLAKRKGYAFIGCNSNGVNAFFVRRDKLPDTIRELSAAEGYVAGKFTETRDEQGLFVPASPEQERLLLLSLPLVDVAKSD